MMKLCIWLSISILLALAQGCSKERRHGDDRDSGDWPYGSDVSVNTDADSDMDSDTDLITDSDSDVDSDSDSDSDADSDTGSASDSDADSDTSSASDSDADADSEVETTCDYSCIHWRVCRNEGGSFVVSGGCLSDEEVCCNLDSAADTDANADSDSDADSDVDVDSDSDTNVVQESDTGALDTALDTDTSGKTLARGLNLTKISAYQAVEIPLMMDGRETADRPAKVVQDKEALLRIHVSVQPEWSVRAIRAELALASSGGSGTLATERTIRRDSTDGDFTSTFNIAIPATYLSGDLKYQISLYETAEGAGEGDDTKARWPETDMASMGEQSVNGDLEVVVIPIQYNADGSGRLPETGEEQLAMYREYFYRNYPIPFESIHITVGEAMPWDYVVGESGDGWDELLYAISDLRGTRGAGPREYYYGALAPARSLRAYCTYGCVAGLGFVPTAPGGTLWDTASAIGLGFEGVTAAETIIHEVGHNHGRLHAPCDVTDPDPNYPYNGGSIGVWGYDVVEQTLVSPEVYTDFMGYCPDRWVSDYTYEGLFDWIVATNKLKRAISRMSTWRSLRIGTRGQVRLGPSYELDLPPTGFEKEVELLDVDLALLDVVPGYFTGFDHLPGGMVLFPDPPDEVVYVRVDGSAPLPL